MAVSKLNPVAAASSKTMYRTTLTSGTSYTVPAGVTYLNVTLVGGGGGGGGSFYHVGGVGEGGQVISSTLSATAGATISYAIGAGGAGTTGASGQPNAGGTGGTTTFTGATSATGGVGGTTGRIQNASNSNSGTLCASNGGRGSCSSNGDERTGGYGGIGAIYIEYWV